MHPISCYLYLITEYRQRTSYWHSTTLGSAIFKISITNANIRCSPNFVFSLGMKEVGSAACWPLFSVLQNKETYNTEQGRDRARRAKGLIRNVDQWPAGCPINLARKFPWGQNERREVHEGLRKEKRMTGRHITIRTMTLTHVVMQITGHRGQGEVHTYSGGCPLLGRF